MKKIFALILLVVMVCTLAACGGKKNETKALDLPAVMSQFALSDEMLTLEIADLMNNYGIAAEDVKQFAAAVSTTGINCDEIVMIEATSAEAAGRVKTALDNRYQAKLVETENYLPDEYAIIKTCSVTVNGNYVAMIVAPNAEELVKIYNGSAK